MPLKNVHYQRLETEDSEGEEDEAPPTHVELHHSPSHVKGNRWNHIENLDEFFERVYDYQQQHGLLAILLSDLFEIVQFMFVILFAVFLVTCLRLDHLLADQISYHENNVTKQRNVAFSDLFDLSLLHRINPIVVMILLLAFAFWIHRLFRTVVRFYRFWGIRTFYSEALGIPPSQLSDATWSDVLGRLKEAQREYKINIRKSELTELDIYHRILRFKNYMVAMVNKGVLPCKFHLPFYGEKVFFTQGLKFNYELILFWPSLKAPFKNSFYLREEYKSASQKLELIANLKFRITVLALLNLIFMPVILAYQILYSFFSYTELLKRQPGVFGRRRWSLYGRYHVRDFNELDHELNFRLSRAYKPSVKYMDLFVHPVLTIFARNIAFVSGALLAVLLVLTVIQEDLLTAHNVLTVITTLGLAITICTVFIPKENQVWCPSLLMQQILGEIHYMPDQWKQAPHTAVVSRQFTHIFQFTLMYVLDELLSPLVTPFILFFCLRPKAADIVAFLRSFTIDVSGVGDVCSFAEMNVRKHGNPEWLPAGVSRANQYEQAELGKTEISLMHFTRKNPNWKPDEDGAMFMSQLRESGEAAAPTLDHPTAGGQPQPSQQESLTYLSLAQPHSGYTAPIVPGGGASAVGGGGTFSSEPQDSMQWSIWSRNSGGTSVFQQPRDVVPSALTSSDHMAASTLDTLSIHQLHDQHRFSAPPPSSSCPASCPRQHSPPTALYSSQASVETAWTIPSDGGDERSAQLTAPLLESAQRQPVETSKGGGASTGDGRGSGGVAATAIVIQEEEEEEGRDPQ